MKRDVPPSHVPGPRLTPASVANQQSERTRALGLPRTTWSSLSRELAVTFLGVLLALAANAWWEGRQERQREHADLEQILATTRENESRLVQAIAEDSATQALADSTRATLSDARTGVRLDSLYAALRRSSRKSDWHPLVAPYTALSQTGALRLVRNAKLRNMLPIYQGELEATIGTLATMDPVAYQNVSESYRLIPRDRIDAALKSATPSGAESARLIGEMRRTGDLRTMLRMERFLSINRLSLLRPLLAQTTVLRNALERELRVPAVSPRAAHVV